MVDERLPKNNDNHIFTDLGELYFEKGLFFHKRWYTEEEPKWWLEEIELPTDEEIDHEGWVGWVKPDPEADAFEKGVKWILDKIK